MNFTKSVTIHVYQTYAGELIIKQYPKISHWEIKRIRVGGKEASISKCKKAATEAARKAYLEQTR